MRLTPDQLFEIFESLDYHVAVYDRAWRYIYVNTEAARILGRAPEELLGRSIWELFPEAVGNQYYSELHQSIATGRIIHSDHYYAPFDRWFENHFYPFTDGVMVLSRDVTGNRLAAIALESAKSEAESANRVKDQFLATLSHELRTPLNAIIGYASLLQANALPPEQSRQAINVIHRNAVTQARLVDDLLDMSRITAGKLRVDLAPTAVLSVLREALDAIRPAADAKRVTLEIDVDQSVRTVRADTTRLKQVFWNLLNNAVKFTNGGGRIVASLRRDDNDVEIAFADTGVGIQPEFMTHVFEPFRQAEGHGRDHAGLGLGLAIAKQLVELQGGTIQVSSAGAGQGTTFTVRLPAIDDDATATTRPS